MRRLAAAAALLGAAEGQLTTPCTSKDDCSNHATAVKGTLGSGCKCTCANKWTGADCSNCPDPYGGGDCNGCKNGWYDFPNCKQCDTSLYQGANCDKCANFRVPTTYPTCDPCPATHDGWFCEKCKGERINYPNCDLCDLTMTPQGTCNGNEDRVVQINSQTACGCRCSRGYEGDACDRCAPGYINYPACTECTGNAHCSDNSDDETDDGTRSSCVCTCRNLWVGANCSVCNATTYSASDPGDDCGACADGWVDYGNGKDGICTDCSDPARVTPGGTCNNNEKRSERRDATSCRCVCKDSHEGTTCDACKSGYINYPTCTRCDSATYFNNRAVGNTISSDAARQTCLVGDCKNNWDPASDCANCPAGNDPAADCGQCLEGWIGYPNCVRCTVATVCNSNAVSVTDNGKRKYCVCTCDPGWDHKKDCATCLDGYRLGTVGPVTNCMATGSPTASPSPQPSASPIWPPTRGPSQGPSAAPSRAPTAAPTAAPSRAPTFSAPTSAPSASPTQHPTTPPSPAPSGAPTSTPTSRPSVPPTHSPSAAPTVSPSRAPSGAPTVAPTARPSTAPSPNPSAAPTVAPSGRPSSPPSPAPSGAPSLSPSAGPSAAPSVAPSTAPSASPTTHPTPASHLPSVTPTVAPSPAPSTAPTRAPSLPPSPNPTAAPSAAPSRSPSAHPSLAPSGAPSSPPSTAPSLSPSAAPTAAPSPRPSAAPSQHPSRAPSLAPSAEPSAAPTAAPSWGPTAAPSGAPSRSPTTSPSSRPSRPPTGAPTRQPTAAPSEGPSAAPSSSHPSTAPSSAPSPATESPTAAPTLHACTDGSHGCSLPPGGRCAAGAGAEWSCHCEHGYVCIGGCNLSSGAPAAGPHRCVLDSAGPTQHPTAAPSARPTPPPSAAPTTAPVPPSVSPSVPPSPGPSSPPSSAAPSRPPSVAPTRGPSAAPTAAPLDPTMPPSVEAPPSLPPTAPPSPSAPSAAPQCGPTSYPASGSGCVQCTVQGHCSGVGTNVSVASSGDGCVCGCLARHTGARCERCSGDLQRYPSCVEAIPEEQLKTTESTAKAASGAVATAAILGGGAAAAGGIGRLTVAKNLNCKVDDVDLEGAEPIDFEYHPIGNPIGGSNHKYFLGSVLMNPLIVLGFLGFAGLGVLFQVTGCRYAPGHRFERVSRAAAMGNMRFPGIAYMPTLFLLQGTSLSASNMSFYPHRAPAGVAVAGVTMFLVCLAVPAGLWRELLRTETFKHKAHLVPDPRLDAEANKRMAEVDGVEEKLLTGCRRKAYVLCFGSSIWVSAPSAPYFVERFGIVFETLREGRQWFPVAELLNMLVLSVLAAWQPSAAGECHARNIILSVFLLGWLIFLLWARPWLARLDFAVGVLLAAMMFVAVAFTTAAIASEGTGASAPLFTMASVLLLVSAQVLMLKGVYDIFFYLLDVKIKRRSRALKTAREEAGREASASAFCTAEEAARMLPFPDRQRLSLSRGAKPLAVPLITRELVPGNPLEESHVEFLDTGALGRMGSVGDMPRTPRGRRRQRSPAGSSDGLSDTQVRVGKRRSMSTGGLRKLAAAASGGSADWDPRTPLASAAAPPSQRSARRPPPLRQGSVEVDFDLFARTLGSGIGPTPSWRVGGGDQGGRGSKLHSPASRGLRSSTPAQPQMTAGGQPTSWRLQPAGGTPRVTSPAEGAAGAWPQSPPRKQRPGAPGTPRPGAAQQLVPAPARQGSVQSGSAAMLREPRKLRQVSSPVGRPPTSPRSRSRDQRPHP